MATLESLEALECGVCLSPLRPPIFQCGVGHVLCSACRDRLASAEICHVCRTPLNGGYQRSHDMEKLVERIRVPCPNAAFGCAVSPVHYDLQDHLKGCLHACHCPAPACSFVGSTAGLTDHLTTVHQWPCSEVRGSHMAEYILLDGFNVLDVIDDGDRRHLLLLSVSREHAGRAVAVFFVCPPARLDTDVAFCRLQVEVSRVNGDSDSDEDSEGHLQQSVFKLAPTDLSDGLPNPDGCFHLIVPKFALPDQEATITISARIRIVSGVFTSLDLSLITL